MKDAIYQNLIAEDRWKYIASGLGVTLRITLFAVMIGIVLGFLVAVVRSTYEKTHKLKVLNLICQVYLTVIRGTPMVVQLLIMYYIVFVSVTSKITVASLAFGINSGAYVAEIIRGGIQSIDNGQFEAGRSLGFNYIQTMMIIVMPQVIKSILPTLLNEFIALLKETSVAGYVGITDLTRGGNIIRGVTFSPFMPLIAVALIYLIMVLLLTYLVGRIERRLKKNER